MKNLNILTGLITLFCTTSVCYGQPFQSTIIVQGVDLNHYSIETTLDEAYVCTGTVYNSDDNTDIHLLKLKASGEILWEVFIDESKIDKALDVAVDRDNNIVITGYVVLNGRPELYLSKFTPSGTQIGNKILRGLPASVGTNIIYSERTNRYIVGGFVANDLSLPFVDNHAILAAFSSNLTYLGHTELIGDEHINSSINDLVETNGGYFVTGAIGTEQFRTVNGILRQGTQGVLAVSLDYDLNMIGNVSFESTNSLHTGVSIAYDTNNDRAYVMSNNSIIHNPEITTIDNISTSPSITNNYYLTVQHGVAVEAAGFQLKISPRNQDVLVAAGYFKTFDTYANTTPWVIEFKAEEGNMISGAIWPVDATNFSLHGDNILSTFYGVHPLIFNQEILTERIDGEGFVLVGPRAASTDYAVDIVTTEGVDCFDKWTFDNFARSWFPVNVESNESHVGSSSYAENRISRESAVKQECRDIRKKSAENNQDKQASKGQTFTENGAFDFGVYPNPTATVFNVELTGENLNGQFTLMNTLGQIVYTSELITGNYHQITVNAESLEQGIYFLSFKSGENHLTKKVTKM